ncbi:MAG: hypothetical protein GF417_03765 [Candidatus Latescibacteria bacterium]|nr:hypothetical protein [bacterium]MBD3423542.1 hypothetical protein [Candidatus Latescibacterota bacterium]
MNRREIIIPALAVLLYLILSIPLAGSVIDDTYIHYQYARNLAEEYQLAFNRGVPSYGATSPLWVFILALSWKAGMNMIFFSHLLSHIFAALSVIMIYFYVTRSGGGEKEAAAAALIMSAEAWLLRWSSVGMESSFAVFMVVAALYLSAGSMDSLLRSVLFGISLALASLTRPEVLLMVPISIVVFVLFRREKLRYRLGWLLAFGVIYSGWLLLVKSHTGTYFPLTAGAKQGWSFLSLHALKRVVLPVKIIGATLLFPAAASLAWLITSRRVLFDTRTLKSPLLFPALWAVSLPAIYVIFDFNILSRYLLPVFPAIIVLGVMAAGDLASRVRKGSRVIISTLVALAILQNIIFYFLVVVPPTRDFSRGMKEVLVPIGKWLGENTPEDAVVATPDIGAIGFYSGREVLDLGGLVTPWINRLRDTLTVEQIIREGYFLRERCDYLIDRDYISARLEGETAGGMEFVPLLADTVANLGIRRQKPVVYTLYRLRPVE